MVYTYIQTSSVPLIFCQEHLGYLSCKINCKPWKLSSISILFCELNQVKWNHIYFSQKKDYFKALPFLCAWMMMICYPRNGWKESIQSLNHTAAPHFSHVLLYCTKPLLLLTPGNLLKTGKNIHNFGNSCWVYILYARMEDERRLNSNRFKAK